MNIEIQKPPHILLGVSIHKTHPSALTTATAVEKSPHSGVKEKASQHRGQQYPSRFEFFAVSDLGSKRVLGEDLRLGWSWF